MITQTGIKAIAEHINKLNFAIAISTRACVYKQVFKFLVK